MTSDYVHNYYPSGYNKEGYDLYGYDKYGYDVLGYDCDKFDKKGLTEVENLKIENANLKKIIKENDELNNKSELMFETLVENNKKLSSDLEKTVDFYDNLSLITTEPLFNLLQKLFREQIWNYDDPEKTRICGYIQELIELPLDSTYRRGSPAERRMLSLPSSILENRYHILWIVGVRTNADAFGGIERCLPNDFIISESPSNTTSYLPRWS